VRSRLRSCRFWAASAIAFGSVLLGLECFAQPSSIARGHQLAERIYARWHIMEGTAPALGPTPLFLSIANQPGTTPARIADYVQKLILDQPIIWISPSSSSQFPRLWWRIDPGPRLKKVSCQHQQHPRRTAVSCSVSLPGGARKPSQALIIIWSEEVMSLRAEPASAQMEPARRTIRFLTARSP
jgi:hypothetical protein